MMIRMPGELEAAVRALRANIETCAMNGDNESIYRAMLHTIYWAVDYEPDEESPWDGATPLVVRRTLGDGPPAYRLPVNPMPEWKRRICEKILSQPLDDGSYVDHC